ncbi:MAG: MBL fold metallo-hydrolase [Firmicutes bacterium]|nr:MBL fold metallo-hydrolase [Bacillota bacterium]
MINLETITVGMFATNCYIVSCTATKEAIVIDPGADAKKIMARIEKEQLTIRAIVNTHGHIDHISANGKLQDEYRVPILLSKLDLGLYHNPGFGLGLVLKKQPDPDRLIKEGDIIKFGEQALAVIDTPGHTEGGVSLVSSGLVFCGDTLFAGSIGRTDLAGGSYQTLLKSIKYKLMILPPDTLVYCGHGPITTIGAEAQTNPFMTGLDS